MMASLAADHGEKKTVMVDATYLKAHRTASSLGAKKGGAGVGLTAPRPDCGANARSPGRRALRHVLFQAALVAAHHNPY